VFDALKPPFARFDNLSFIKTSERIRQNAMP
jgi:hypothetical protein